MFEASSPYYDAIYTFKNYRSECNRIYQIIREHNPMAKSLLSVACGTGEHDKFLKSDFEIKGIDLNETFLERAREKNPECKYEKMDMRDLKMDGGFDAITCLFSSIGYLASKEELVSAFKGMASLLSDKGILIVEPWMRPEQFEDGRLFSLQVDEPELKIARITRSEKHGNKSTLYFDYLFAEKGKPVKHASEKHVCTLFTVEETKEAFEKAGLKADFIESGLADYNRGLFIAKVQ